MPKGFAHGGRGRVREDRGGQKLVRSHTIADQPKSQRGPRGARQPRSIGRILVKKGQVKGHSNCRLESMQPAVFWTDLRGGAPNFGSLVPAEHNQKGRRQPGPWDAVAPWWSPRAERRRLPEPQPEARWNFRRPPPQRENISGKALALHSRRGFFSEWQIPIIRRQGPLGRSRKGSFLWNRGGDEVSRFAPPGAPVLFFFSCGVGGP